MKKTCPICGNKNAGTTYPFGSILCDYCGFDEDYYTVPKYKRKLKKEGEMYDKQRKFR